MEIREMDEHVTYLHQLQSGDGPVILMNQFSVPVQEVERFLEVWSGDAGFMRQQPGFISTQLHRGIEGSTTFINIAVWESPKALGEAFRSPEFQRSIARYPAGVVASPHLFKKVAVTGICVQ